MRQLAQILTGYISEVRKLVQCLHYVAAAMNCPWCTAASLGDPQAMPGGKVD